MESNRSWNDILFGGTTDKGMTFDGNLGGILQGVGGLASAGVSWAALNESKAQNERTYQSNVINSQNAATSYNTQLEDKTRARRSQGGASKTEIDDYLNSTEFKRKRAKSL